MGRQGVRVEWSEVPSDVRDGVEQLLDASVVRADNMAGGFSPGPAARCELSDGRVVFIKAAGTELNPFTPGMHRREADVLACLPDDVPAPKLLGIFDDGDWVAVITEFIAGRTPVAPVDSSEVDRLLALAERLSALEAPSDLVADVEPHEGLVGHWQQLIDDPIDGLDTWSQQHLHALAEVEHGAEAAISGNTLTHLDLRTDNVVFAATGPDDDVIVDWAATTRASPWCDLVGLLPALELDGGPRPEDMFEQQPQVVGVDPDVIDTFIAAVAGYFTRQSLLPAPRGLPTVRAFQAAQGIIARRWIANRRGWS